MSLKIVNSSPLNDLNIRPYTVIIIIFFIIIDSIIVKIIVIVIIILSYHLVC